MNIFNFEFKKLSFNGFIWSVSTVLFMILFMAFFPMFSEEAELMNTVMNSFPPEFKAAFGIGNVDLSTVLGYVSFTFVYLQLALATQAAMYGFGNLSLEERELTAEFLLSKPVSRTNIYFSKCIASILVLFISLVIVLLGSILSIELFTENKPYELNVLFHMFIGTFILQTFFYSSTLLISLFFRKIKNVIGPAMSYVFAFYVISAFSSALKDNYLRYFTPFQYFDPSKVIEVGTVNAVSSILGLVLSAGCVYVGYILFMKRNITTV